MKIMIDPGHGPGNGNRGQNGYYEYAGMWKLSNYLKAVLERCGLAVELTRSENECPDLDARGKAAKGCDLFISEHSNAGGGKGCECYYSIRIPDDYQFATDIAKAVSDVLGDSSRGAKVKESTNTAGYDYYTVIYSAQYVGCPHVFICENGFHDNADDEAKLKDDAYLLRIAEAQAKVICQHLGTTYVEDKPAAPVSVGYSVGDTVHFAGGAVYASATASQATGNRKECDTQVTIVVAGKPHPYHCIGGGVYGWVDAASIGASAPAAAAPVPAAHAPLAVGDKVRIRDGADTFTNGAHIASFVRSAVLYVRQIGSGKVLVSTSATGAVTGWVKTDDIVRA